MRTKISLLLLCSFQMFAQKLSLPQLVNFAYQNNKNIDVAIKNVEMQRALVNTAYETPKMAFEMQFGNIQNPNIRDYAASAIQFFDLPKAYNLRKQYNLALVKIGESQLAMQKQELAYQIGNIYFEIYYLLELQNLYSSEAEKLKEIEVIAKNKYKEGEIDKSDPIGIGIKIKEIELKSKRIEIEKNRQWAYLQILLGSNEIPQVNFKNWSTENSNPLDFTNNKQILFQKQVIESSQLEVSNLKAKLLPTLKGGLVNQSMMGFKNQFIGVGGVEIPIFRQAQKARINAANINQKMKEMELEKIESQIMIEWQSAKKRVLSLKENQDFYQQQMIPENIKLMELVTKKYHAGSIDYLEWHVPYMQYLNVKVEALGIDKELNLNLNTIKFIEGNETL